MKILQKNLWTGCFKMKIMIRSLVDLKKIIERRFLLEVPYW